MGCAVSSVEEGGRGVRCTISPAGKYQDGQWLIIECGGSSRVVGILASSKTDANRYYALATVIRPSGASGTQACKTLCTGHVWA